MYVVINEALSGNFSFFILVVGVVQLALMAVNLIVLLRRKD